MVSLWLYKTTFLVKLLLKMSENKECFFSDLVSIKEFVRYEHWESVYTGLSLKGRFLFYKLLKCKKSSENT